MEKQNKNFIDKILEEGTLGVMEHKVSTMSIVGLGLAAVGAGLIILVLRKFVFK